MDHESPIRSWVRKHSPIRNKPLPIPPSGAAAPKDEKTLREISGNTSPTKRPSKSKLRSFLRNKPQLPSPTRSPPPEPRPRSNDEGRGRRQPSPTDPNERRTSIRKPLRPRHGSSDLRGLSRKISSLEAQLKEAREELDNVSRRTSAVYYTPEEDQKEWRREDRRSGVPKYDHLVEKLLDWTGQDDHTRGLTHSNTANFGVSRDRIRKVEEAIGVDDAYSSDTELQQHKRKRSEVRQASWETVQNHLQKQQQLQHKAQESKRSRNSTGKSINIVSPRSKDLPQLPEFPTPPARTNPSEYPIQVSQDEENDNGCPPLDRHRRSFSQPLPGAANAAPKVKGHRRRRSQIIEEEQLQEAFGQVVQAEPDNSSRKANPPSPRRKLSSPSKLDKVDEEFEWDEDIF